MIEKYNELEVEVMFESVMSDVTKAIGEFEKTLSYRQLRYSEQKDAREIILTFGEWLFDYHLEEMTAWSETSIKDILVVIFPHKISANVSFFRKITPILCSFLEFLYYANLQKNGLKLSGAVKEVDFLMINEVEVLQKNSKEKKLFDLGEEMGLDMSDLSDLERLYTFVELFENPEKKSKKTKIINFSDIVKQKKK